MRPEQKARTLEAVGHSMLVHSASEYLAGQGAHGERGIRGTH